jgi:hypothetical protein
MCESLFTMYLREGHRSRFVGKHRHFTTASQYTPLLVRLYATLCNYELTRIILQKSSQQTFRNPLSLACSSEQVEILNSRFQRQHHTEITENTLVLIQTLNSYYASKLRAHCHHPRRWHRDHVHQSSRTGLAVLGTWAVLQHTAEAGLMVFEELMSLLQNTAEVGLMVF